MSDERSGERVVLAFPGQGSHEEGMRDVVARWRPELLDTLAAVAGDDAFERAEASTAAAQPAIVCASVAHWHARGCPRGEWAIGHSLGELTALVAAGSLDEHDAVRLAARRGQLMQEASDAHPGCGMLAAKAAVDDVAPIAEELGVAVGNNNAPNQVVLSGSAEQLDRARERLKEAGIRSTRLRVAGAFHSPLMASAVEPLRAALAEIEFSPPACVVFSPISVAPMEDPRRELPDSLLSPVRWVEAVQALADGGAERFEEIGPGGVLTRLIELSLSDVFDRAAD
ncbi:MAG TPA: ACP S-malonyltransferase [Thermoleophilaceae bacterium]|nr:ACP S-malonyltransferase [Thermoleophilaceae bacterium]